MPEDFLTVEEAAKEVRCGVKHMQRLCREGKIGSTQPAGKGGCYLIPRASLDDYLKIRR